MEVEIPNELLEQILEKNSILFAGSGLSASAGFPTWSQLIHEMMRWANKHSIDLGRDKEEFEKLIKENEFLLVAENLRKYLSNDLFRQFMRSTFRDSNKKPSQTHFILTEIPFAAVLTTNYDVLLESAYTVTRGIKPWTYTHADATEIVSLNRQRRFYILKVHGDIDHFDTIVVSQSDYRKLMFNNEAYRHLLRIIFTEKTVFFVGFSLSDPDLLFLLDELEAIFNDQNEGGRTLGKHFALLNTREAGNIRRKSWENNYGIHIIPYEATEGHPEVREILLNISQEISERNVSSTFKKIQSGIHRSNFIIEGSSQRARNLMAERLRDFLRKETRRFSPVMIQVDMERVSEQEFLHEIGKEFLREIASKYLSIGKDEGEEREIKKVTDLEKLIKETTSRFQKANQKQISVVLLLFNATALNFGLKNKEDLHMLLEAPGLELTAIIVAQELDSGGSSEWNISPWDKPYLRTKLE